MRRWVPELRDVPLEHLAEPWKSGAAPDYPPPMVDHAQERRRAIARYRAV